jgi:hypothetical protein
MQARKAYWGSGVEAPYNLHIGISLKTAVPSTYLPLYPGEATPFKHLLVSLVGTRKVLMFQRREKYLTSTYVEKVSRVAHSV